MGGILRIHTYTYTNRHEVGLRHRGELLGVHRAGIVSALHIHDWVVGLREGVSFSAFRSCANRGHSGTLPPQEKDE